jgi:hypothetical protein
MSTQAQQLAITHLAHLANAAPRSGESTSVVSSAPPREISNAP